MHPAVAKALDEAHFVRMSKPFPDPHFVDANGVKLAIYEVNGDPNGAHPPIILVHGWPEIANSWRNQINALAEAGYRAIAVDLKGFGQSDAPTDKSLYDIVHLTSDLAALLDALEIERAVFCGHDWGGALVWSMGQLRPERVAGIIGVCTPLRPRPPAPPIEIIKQRFTQKHYFVQFQEERVPEELFSTDIARFFELMFRKPASREKWLSLMPGIYDLPERFRTARAVTQDDLIVSEEVISTYVAAYRRSGFHGGINLYRNVDRNWELMEGRDEIIRAPSMWVGAELDIFLPPESADGMERLIPDLEKHVIADCGHWVTWEQPDALNALLIDWLKRQISI